MAYREEGVDLDHIREINVSDFDSGIYVISIRIDGMHRITKQFVKR